MLQVAELNIHLFHWSGRLLFPRYGQGYSGILLQAMFHQMIQGEAGLGLQNWL